MAEKVALEYARRIGVRADTTIELIEKIHAGLSYQSFEKLRKELGLSVQQLAEVVQIAPRTLTRRKSAGRFKPDESDRILRASRVYDEALELFEGERGEARHWLTTPKAALSGRSPLDFSITEVGAREVENLIGRLERGVFA
jgi:putative toxin-antitoxin system antitoxin component (TIGR02293 family)